MKSRVIVRDEFKDKLRGSLVITGFRTLGEVGYLATRHLVTQMKMRKVGAIVTKYQRDLAFLDSYGLASPYDIFLDEDRKIVVILNHLLPLQREWSDFTETTVKWALRSGINEAILVGGLDRRYKSGEGEKLRWLRNSASTKELNFPTLEKQQLIVGPLALFITYSDIYRFPTTVLLPYADRERPDPAAAAVAIQIINETLGINVDINGLLEDAKRIEEEISKQIQLIQQEINKHGTDRVYM